MYYGVVENAVANAVEKKPIGFVVNYLIMHRLDVFCIYNILQT